jgi:hypothetical protein
LYLLAVEEEDGMLVGMVVQVEAQELAQPLE